MTPEDLRATIPAIDPTIYLNVGANGPSPQRVQEGVIDFLTHQEGVAPATDDMTHVGDETLRSARTAVARVLSATASEVALTPSTTDGINLVSEALEWEPSDTIVRTDIEHPSGILPWDRLRDRYGVTIDVVNHQNGRIDPDHFKDAVSSDTRLVCLSSVAWNYGTQLPVREVAEIAHDAGALILVDAAQQTGQLPIDISHVDFLAGTGHKWLLGPRGAGFLYVAADSRHHLQPQRIGWRSVKDDTVAEYEYKDDASLFEVSTMPEALFRGLELAVETIEDIGIETVRDRIQRLATQLTETIPADRLLSPRDPESGLVSFRVDNPERFVDRLQEAGIVIRQIPDPSGVRASIHAFNTPNEIGTLTAHI